RRNRRSSSPASSRFPQLLLCLCRACPLPGRAVPWGIVVDAAADWPKRAVLYGNDSPDLVRKPAAEDAGASAAHGPARIHPDAAKFLSPGDDRLERQNDRLRLAAWVSE